MSFKSVAKSMSSKENISMKEASKRLAGHTYKIMKRHKIDTKHGIPKGVFSKFKKKVMS